MDFLVYVVHIAEKKTGKNNKVHNDIMRNVWVHRTDRAGFSFYRLSGVRPWVVYVSFDYAERIEFIDACFYELMELFLFSSVEQFKFN